MTNTKTLQNITNKSKYNITVTNKPDQPEKKVMNTDLPTDQIIHHL